MRHKQTTLLYQKATRRFGREYPAGSTCVMPEEDAWAAVRDGRGIIVERRPVRRDKQFRQEGLQVK